MVFRGEEAWHGPHEVDRWGVQFIHLLESVPLTLNQQSQDAVLSMEEVGVPTSHPLTGGRATPPLSILELLECVL